MIAMARIKTLWKNRIARRLTGGVAIVLLLLYAGRGIGRWLTIADHPPAHLDLVCMFGGEQRRVNYAKELMGKYRSAHWLLSDYKNGYGRVLQESAYEMDRVSVVDTCQNTLSEVHFFSSWINDNCIAGRFSSDDGTTHEIHIGLVSSPYHMRRIKIMADRWLKNKKVTLRLYCLPVPLQEYGWNSDTFGYWWRSRWIASLTLSEFFKIAYFIFTGYL